MVVAHWSTSKPRTKPEVPSTTRSPAAPVKGDTMHGVPHCIASLQTRPQASLDEGSASMRADVKAVTIWSGGTNGV